MTARESSSEHWDEAVFRAFFLQHYARIVAILVRLLGDRSHAEEVANDAFWRLYRRPALQSDGNAGVGCTAPRPTSESMPFALLIAATNTRQLPGGSRKKKKAQPPVHWTTC